MPVGSCTTELKTHPKPISPEQKALAILGSFLFCLMFSVGIYAWLP